MIIDTSAIVAIAQKEAGHEKLEECIKDAGFGRMSAVATVELQVVLAHRGMTSSDFVPYLLDRLGIETVSVTAYQANIARQAYLKYGKVSKCRAKLNFGDCFSYALAIALNEPLLFVGDDFSHTDVLVALKSGESVDFLQQIGSILVEPFGA